MTMAATQGQCPHCMRSEQPMPSESDSSDGLGCAICGGKMVLIRGRYPGMEEREVCPTCMAETLDDLKDRLRADYTQAAQAT